MRSSEKWGDPVFSANVTNPIDPYAELIRHYRERWAHHGHDPADALVGSPEQVIDKVGRFHEQFGHEVIHLSAERDGRTENQYLDSLFQAEVAPELRRRIPSRPLATGREFSGVTS